MIILIIYLKFLVNSLILMLSILYYWLITFVTCTCLKWSQSYVRLAMGCGLACNMDLAPPLSTR